MIDDWDLRFLRMAELVSTWSKDPSTKTGAVIALPDHRVASLGFNGFPKGMEDRAEWLENREEKYSRIIHCEMNALMFAGRDVAGCTLYTWPFPSCDRCAVHMLQAGIRRFVAPIPSPELQERWGPALERTQEYVASVGGTLIMVAM